MTSPPIADHAYLSDCHTGALVTRDGTVDWWCAPRFDSPSTFATLLDPDAGSWSIGARNAIRSSRRYVPGTLVLETKVESDQGRAVLTDALVLAMGDDAHRIGMTSPHVMVRTIEVTHGTMSFDIEFRPRPEYGIVRPRLAAVDGGVQVSGGASAFFLSGPAPLLIADDHAIWEVRLDADERGGHRVRFSLEHGSVPNDGLSSRSDKVIDGMLETTIDNWQSWSELHQGYNGYASDRVRLSGRILLGLTYMPTGAIVAAATTSLPETTGGTLNWDYRYGWIRDVSLTMSALFVAACPKEADRFLTWLLDTAGTVQAGDVQIMYGITGEHDLSERELPHLRGWNDSVPVRVGNGAWNQPQLDVFGELLDAVACLRSQLGELDRPTATLLVDLARAAADRWTEQDHSIWELRGPKRDYLYSKLMCWVALDRAIEMADWLSCESEVEAWTSTRNDIRHAILEHGWNEDVGAYTQSFGSDVHDASALMLAITGFVPADDPRMRSTIEAIATELAADDGGMIRRFVPPDDSEPEGTFVLCSYWLVQCWALLGETERAERLFEHISSHENDLGLLSEQIDPASGSLLGNFPQAFSHVGMVNAAAALDAARRAAS